MSRMTKEDAMAAANQAWQRTRQAAADVKPAAAQVKPLAEDTRAAASRGLRNARAWAAPQLERTGQVLEDTVAPKVSAALVSSARRIDPDKPKGRRWRTLAGAAILVAAATALVAVLRKRTPPVVPAGDTEPAPEPVKTD